MTTQAKTRFPLFVFMLFTLASCGSDKKEGDQNKEQLIKKTKRQDVYDSHGCLTSAGYLWSEVKDTCIRLWETGSELQPTDRSELVVFAVLSDDKMEAEIFIPDDGSFILKGKGNGVYTNDSLNLIAKGKDLLLKKGGKTIYQTGSPEPIDEKPIRRKGRKH